MQNWKNIRKKGRWHFVLTKGMLLIGMSLFVFLHLYRWLIEYNAIMHNYIQSIEVKEIIVQFITMLISGLLIGFYIWHQFERYYQRSGLSED